jgi:hypothetical protein
VVGADRDLNYFFSFTACKYLLVGVEGQSIDVKGQKISVQGQSSEVKGQSSEVKG